MLRRRYGTSPGGMSLMFRPATQTAPCSGCSWRLSSRSMVRLARPGRADEEDELALGDVEAGVTERDDVGGVDLGDVLESDHAKRRR